MSILKYYLFSISDKKIIKQKKKITIKNIINFQFGNIRKNTNKKTSIKNSFIIKTILQYNIETSDKLCNESHLLAYLLFFYYLIISI